MDKFHSFSWHAHNFIISRVRAKPHGNRPLFPSARSNDPLCVDSGKSYRLETRSAKNEQRANMLQVKVSSESLSRTKKTRIQFVHAAFPRVCPPPSFSSCDIPPRIPYSSRHADGRVDGTPRRHRVSRLSPSMGGFRLCTVSPWIQREEWIKFGDTPLRRVRNRMIPKQIFPLFRRLTCFDPISS